MNDRNDHHVDGLDAELCALVDRLIDQAIGDAEMARLNALMVENATLRAYVAERAELHAMLTWDAVPVAQPLTGDEASAVVGRIEQAIAGSDELPSRARGGRAHSSLFRYAAAAVLLIVAGIAVVALRAPRTTDERVAVEKVDDGDGAVATLTHVKEAEWEPGTGDAPDLGASLDRGRLRLRAGSVEMLMRSTAMVTVLGPADVEMVGPNRCRLRSGRMMATVPQRAHGFTVETPTHTVVDLGTRFGVEVSGSRDTHVSVFEGRVEVRPLGAAESSAVTLRAGEAVEIDGTSGGRSSAAAEPFRFVVAARSGLGVDHADPPALLIDGVAGHVAEPPDAVRPLPRYDGGLVVVLESQDVALSDPIPATLSEPGSVSQFEQTHGVLVDAGVKVSSYLVRFAPQSNSDAYQRIQGELRFDGEIVAVVAATDAVNRGTAKLRSPHVVYADTLQLEPDTDVAVREGSNDRLTLDADRHTLRVDLGVSRRRFNKDKALIGDNFRVITRSSPDAPSR
ncbi:MAG: hypothetical protein GC159_22745 [Phycisphaera sp.]|nr:hypothetical protein [Phycisphaera sp.]